MQIVWTSVKLIVNLALSAAWGWSAWSFHQSLYKLRARQATENALLQVVKVYEAFVDHGDTSLSSWGGEEYPTLNQEAFLALYLVVGLYILILKRLGIE